VRKGVEIEEDQQFRVPRWYPFESSGRPDSIFDGRIGGRTSEFPVFSGSPFHDNQGYEVNTRANSNVAIGVSILLRCSSLVGVFHENQSIANLSQFF
jgi:hypothetical protein